jgi:hypothetical protein
MHPEHIFFLEECQMQSQQQQQRFMQLLEEENAKHPLFDGNIACDQACYTYMTSTDRHMRYVLEEQVLQERPSETTFRGWNATSIGNACCVEAFTDDDDVRKACANLRAAYFEWTREYI